MKLDLKKDLQKLTLLADKRDMDSSRDFSQGRSFFARLQLGAAVYLILAVGSIPNWGSASSDDSCACPTVNCPPCQVEEGVSFYSEKCGPKKDKVRSCKKMACVPISEDQQVMNACLAKHGLNPVEVSSSSQGGASEDTNKDWAAVVHELSGESLVARVQAIKGQPDQGLLSKGEKLVIGDRVFTGPNATLKIGFRDGSFAVLSKSSELVIEEVRVEPKKRSIKLGLFKGKMQSTVAKAGGAENGQATRRPTATFLNDASESKPSYSVRTPTAVAGVRGTVFTTEYVVDELGAKTVVSTQSGLVELSSGHLDSELKSVLIGKGHRAEHRVPLGAGGVFDFSSESISEAMPTTSRSIRLDREPSSQSLLPKSTEAASQSGFDCEAPRGQFNQCSWTCEGASAYKKAAGARCPVDRPGVSCVRRVCRANGKWEEATRQPASESSRCNIEKVRVTDCDTPW